MANNGSFDLWTNQSIKEFWEHNKSDYAGDSNAKEIVRLSKKHIKGKVLDVGAGSGALMSLIPNSVGIDVAPKNPNIIKASIDKLPFDDGYFDTVFITDVLEHLTDETLIKGIKEVNRVLKSGGKLIIVIPYKEDLKQSVVFCPNCKLDFHRWGHLRVFNDYDITILLHVYGNVRITYFRNYPLGLMARNILIRYMWWFFVKLKWISANDLLVIAEK